MTPTHTYEGWPFTRNLRQVVQGRFDPVIQTTRGKELIAEGETHCVEQEPRFAEN